MQISLGRCHFGGDDAATMTGVRPGRTGWIAVCERHRQTAEDAGYTLREIPAPVMVAAPPPPPETPAPWTSREPAPPAAPGSPPPWSPDVGLTLLEPDPVEPVAAPLVVRLVVVSGDRTWSKPLLFAQVPRIDDRVAVVDVLARVEMIAWAPDDTGMAVPTALCRLDQPLDDRALDDDGWSSEPA